ncbi:ATP-grasp domain-containing protein [Peribacillus glennii]|uniref:ATP-grasp domain-containing protein n=1 Tax=Peribacillus glennii TaxID=2303991 RepID=A0A372L827_9BACI|nr:ATP-grasp domain-containing protein [Peribacillus glennii]RFU60465.1 ATP-grasp domain-containing protein [Peribacillus glennii]
MKPVFLVLGGTQNSLPVIRKAQELGLRVLVIDPDKNAIAARRANYFEVEDPNCLECVEKIARKYNVVGSMTRNELYVATVCFLNEVLNLPKQGEDIGDSVRDKYVMKQAFKRDGITMPDPFYKIENKGELETVRAKLKKDLLDSPFIVKPSDQRGSIGITKIEKLRGFDKAVAKALKRANNQRVIVEKFIDGEQLGAQGFSIDGELVKCFISRKTSSPTFVSLGHSFPIDLSPEVIWDIEEECAKALRSLGIINGPSTIDINLDKQGKPHIIEIGARAGGTVLPETILAHTGIDLIKASVALASGRKVEFPMPKNVPVAAHKLCFPKSGKIKNIRNYRKLIQHYKPADFKLNINRNMNVIANREYGYVIITGNTGIAEKKCSEFILELRNLIELY